MDVQLPDGTVVQFPDDMSPDDIKAVLQKQFGKPEKPVEPHWGHQIGAVTDGLAQGLTFGFSDEIAAGLDSGFGLLGSYDESLKAERDRMAENQRLAGWSRLAGEIPGAALSTVGTGGLGLAAKSGASLGTNIGRAALEGAAYGGLYGAGTAEDDRLAGAAKGAAMGAATGAALQPVIAGTKAAGRSVAGWAGFGNDSRAKLAIADALRRSGKTADDVAGELAAADPAQRYMVADAMGNSGQRMLTGVMRSPGDYRQKIFEALTDRQIGQGERLSSAVAKGFGANQTAAQRVSRMKAARSAIANTNYDAARAGAGKVDLTGALGVIDDRLTPGVQKFATDDILGDSIDGLYAKFRRRMADGSNSQLVDFDRVLSVKQDISDQIGKAVRAGENNKARALGKLQAALDQALESASDGYRRANDTFARQSRVIDAVDTGTNAAGSRVRSADAINTFNRLSPQEQSAFRTGYADPVIRRIEGASLSPMTNKARPLMTGKTQAEFPAFAKPGRADALGDAIAREQRMFETANAALGGSRTADNLADIADVQSFDPTMLGALMTGNIKGAAIQGMSRAAASFGGKNETTRDLIARALMETGPTRAKVALAEALLASDKSTRISQRDMRALLGAFNAVAN